MIPGRIIGNITAARNASRPKKRYRCTAHAASVPKIAAIVTDAIATRKLLNKPACNRASIKA